ncbi:MAG: hypothetical protein JWP75_2150, partial [Frondihabitans sp.]|nr:hypothetical protein [Frondihabitans sp.]
QDNPYRQLKIHTLHATPPTSVQFVLPPGTAGSRTWTLAGRGPGNPRLRSHWSALVDEVGRLAGGDVPDSGRQTPTHEALQRHEYDG